MTGNKNSRESREEVLRYGKREKRGRKMGIEKRDGGRKGER